MKLFIMRHGTAEPWANDETDFDRKLTVYGREEVSRQGEAFASQWYGIETWASPYIRTQESAAILSATIGRDVKSTRLITPESSLVGIRDCLLVQSTDLLLVSHQPLVSRLISMLTGRPLADCPMDTASVAVLSGDIMATDCMVLEGIWHSHGSVSR